MSERIVLLTVRRENPTRTELLVRGNAEGWVPVTGERRSDELPVETAVRTGESLFGPDSVCSLWLLGTSLRDGMISHFYCLDLDAVAVGAPLPDDCVWISLDDAAVAFTGQKQALFSKLGVYRR